MRGKLQHSRVNAELSVSRSPRVLYQFVVIPTAISCQIEDRIVLHRALINGARAIAHRAGARPASAPYAAGTIPRYIAAGFSASINKSLPGCGAVRSAAVVYAAIRGGVIYRPRGVNKRARGLVTANGRRAALLGAGRGARAHDSRRLLRGFRRL
ncbi:hypothetical protein EVAR_58097_1 [Eumeta japonica]|uniref:Uncharacterized protein n=1 Tax=Eumeta variegata TaxID=151549 RepID=A0A4C1YJM5_EUMVA|nr:hypothetical protein EVAR_58097_1 [Eumeta japonica]